MKELSKRAVLLFIASMCVLNSAFAMNLLKKNKGKKAESATSEPVIAEPVIAYNISIVDECVKILQKSGVSAAHKYLENLKEPNLGDEFTRQALFEIFNDRDQIDSVIEEMDCTMASMLLDVNNAKIFADVFSPLLGKFLTALPDNIREFELGAEFVLRVENTKKGQDEYLKSFQDFKYVKNNVEDTFSSTCYQNSISNKFYLINPKILDLSMLQARFLKSIEDHRPIKAGNPARFVMEHVEKFLNLYLVKYFFNIDVSQDQKYWQFQITKNNYRYHLIKDSAIKDIIADRISIAERISDLINKKKIGVRQLEEVKTVLEKTLKFINKYTIVLSENIEIRQAIKNIPHDEEDAKWQEVWDNHGGKPVGYKIFHDVVYSDDARYMNATSRSIESVTKESGSEKEGSPPKLDRRAQRSGSSSSIKKEPSSPEVKRIHGALDRLRSLSNPWRQSVKIEKPNNIAPISFDPPKVDPTKADPINEKVRWLHAPDSPKLPIESEPEGSDLSPSVETPKLRRAKSPRSARPSARFTQIKSEEDIIKKDEKPKAPEPRTTKSCEENPHRVKRTESVVRLQHNKPIVRVKKHQPNDSQEMGQEDLEKINEKLTEKINDKQN